jgi:hypothetical protein
MAFFQRPWAFTDVAWSSFSRWWRFMKVISGIGLNGRLSDSGDSEGDRPSLRDAVKPMAKVEPERGRNWRSMELAAPTCRLPIDWCMVWARGPVACRP